jgi:hypothetical protein
MMTCLCALMLAMSPPAQKAPGSPGTASQDLIVIDGHKDPSKIPEWAAWEDGFTTLALWIGRDSGFNHDLREALSPGEFSRLEREAVAQAARRAEAIRETELLRPGLASMDPKDTGAAKALLDRIHAIDLKYRRATLAARDRVLQSLSPGSQAVLQAWIERGRATMICEVPRSELAHWRSPE